jgi:predicted transcriptional regulator
MKKERVRLSLDLSPELYAQLKDLAEVLDLTITSTIRLALQDYIKNKKETN